MTGPRAVVLAVLVMAVGCGKDSPTEPTPRSIAVTVNPESDIDALAFACVSFRQEAAGAASATSGLPPGPIEIGTGSCTGTRTVVASSQTGSVAATLPVGDSFVRFQNPGDARVRYRLTLTYLRLF